MSKFKVIVVGGGPVGLVAAHGLAKAGIDYVVLEAHPELAKDTGASLVMTSYSVRVLAHLGLLDKMQEKGHEVIRWAKYANEKMITQSYTIEDFKEDHGVAGLMFHRAELVQLIYDGLSPEDKQRIHLNKKVASIESTDDGVVVTTTDGSTYQGDIVLGADGVHSKVRSIMSDHRRKAVPETSENDRPYLAEYRTLWFSVPRRFEFTPGDHCTTHGNGVAVQFLTSHNRSWVFVYERLDKPTRERVKYTEEDVDAFVARHGEIPIGNRLKVKDIAKHRTTGGLTNLEEGIATHWSHGRIVLAGDACHKFTPNAGTGLNNGIQDVIALVNELHALAKLAGPPPSVGELGAAFERYREMRRERVQYDFDFSWKTVRLWTWATNTYWFFDQWVLPLLPWRDELLRRWIIQPMFSQALCFDFLEGKEPFEGKVSWVHRMKKPSSV